jgi:hypothetical protein
MMNTQLTKDLSKINYFIKNFDNKKYKIIDNNSNIYSSNNNFFYKFVLSGVLNDSPYRSFFIDWLIESEKVFPNSSKYLLQALYKRYINNYYEDNQIKSRKANIKDLEKILNVFVSNESIKIFKELMNISGPDSLINLDSTSNDKIIIKKQNFTKFDKIYCHESLSNILFNNSEKSKRDVIFIAIDGFLERDTDLQYAYIESQENKNKIIVILCRGTNAECIQNIKRNIIYTKCPVLIYECPFINDDPLKFDDLCKSLYVNPVKIEDGDPTIIQIKNKLKKLENITLGIDWIEFENKNDSLINEINDLLIEKQEYKEYLQFRKKRLKSKKVDILIPKNKKNILADLKTILFVYNSVCKHGVIEEKEYIMPKQLNELVKKYSNEFYLKISKISTIIKIK